MPCHGGNGVLLRVDAAHASVDMGAPLGEKGKRELTAAVLAALVASPVFAAKLLANAPAAGAEPGGVDQTPVMGWSSWSFLGYWR